MSLLRYTQAPWDKNRREDEEPTDAGLRRAILIDLKFRFKALTGFSLAFPSMRPYSLPRKRFIQWALWEEPIEERAKNFIIKQFWWERQ